MSWVVALADGDGFDAVQPLLVPAVYWPRGGRSGAIWCLQSAERGLLFFGPPTVFVSFFVLIRWVFSCPIFFLGLLGGHFFVLQFIFLVPCLLLLSLFACRSHACVWCCFVFLSSVISASIWF